MCREFRRCEGNRGECRESLLIAEEVHVGIEQRLCDFRPSCRQQVFVHNKCFCSIARCCVVCLESRSQLCIIFEADSTHFRIYSDSNCLLCISSLIKIHCAESICMSHDGDAGAVLNAPHETIAAARDDKVDVLIELKQSRHLGTSLNSLNICVRD